MQARHETCCAAVKEEVAAHAPKSISLSKVVGAIPAAATTAFQARPVKGSGMAVKACTQSEA